MPPARGPFCNDLIMGGKKMTDSPASSWNAGTARAVITPAKPMWLSGYGDRDRPSESTLHDIWIKVLALEDSSGQRALIMTSDLCGISRGMYDSLCRRFEQDFALSRSDIMFCFTHNHCAPVTVGDLIDYYPLDKEQLRRVEEYSAWLETRIVETAAKALADMVPASLHAGEGTCTFAVNRRENPAKEVPAVLAKGGELKGPVDHSVPVLAVRAADGSLLAIVFGYACHNTTLDFYRWCGDYAGFAQIAVGLGHPGASAMCFTGCGGDQNPLPRRSVELCEKYGKMLAEAVEEVLGSPMRELAPSLGTAFDFITLDFERNPTREELEEAAQSPRGVFSRWANRLLKFLDDGGEFEKSCPYPVQVWHLGDEQLWISLGAEAVVDYSLRFKKEYGPRTWVGGYTHTQVAYIPSQRVWREGGYEGGHIYEYGHHAYRWADGMEERIAAAVSRLVRMARAGQAD